MPAAAALVYYSFSSLASRVRARRPGARVSTTRDSEADSESDSESVGAATVTRAIADSHDRDLSVTVTATVATEFRPGISKSTPKYS